VTTRQPPPPPAGRWVLDAVCTQTDPEIFFPDKGGNPDPAKQICRTCPVRTQCLEHALTSGVSGVWGGTTYNERLRLKRTVKETTPS